jgi:hypothetical protein
MTTERRLNNANYLVGTREFAGRKWDVMRLRGTDKLHWIPHNRLVCP